MPQARKKHRPDLNCAYAFAASENFIQTAQSLRDALIEGAGFQRLEANNLVVPEEYHQVQIWDTDPLFLGASEQMIEIPYLSRLGIDLENRVKFNKKMGTLTVQGAISELELKAIQKCFRNPQDQKAVERLFHRTKGRIVREEQQEYQKLLNIPLLMIRNGEQLELFEENHFMDIPWDLAECNSMLLESEFPSEYSVGVAGEIDITDNGRVEMTNFVRNLHEQLTMFAFEPGWTTSALANWLDHKIHHPDITRAQSSLFIHNVLTKLMEDRQLEIDHLARHKFRLAKSIEAKIDQLRREQRKKAYQRVLFGLDTAEIEVNPANCLIYNEERYSPNWYYEGGYRFQNHLFSSIGELKKEGEEFECAVYIDQMDAVEVWVRNLERWIDSSFWLQTSTDRFYPDFVLLLNDGRILVVEYKGEHLWSNDDSKEKRAVGELWAERSNGKCIFVMPKGKDWSAIEEAIK